MSTVKGLWRRVDAYLSRDPRHDASMLIGMQSMRALVLALVLVAGATVIGMSAGGVKSYPMMLLAMGLIAVAAVTLVVAPGVKLVWSATLAVAFLLPASIVLSPLAADWPEPGLVFGVINGSAAVATAYLCVRGRPIMGFLTVLLIIPAGRIAMAIAGHPIPQLSSYVTQNIALVAMAGIFAVIAHPTARAIYQFRAQTEAERAQEAAEQAVIAERDEQLARLDSAARPLLEKLLAGEGLDAHDRRLAVLVEARLRDEIRAPALRHEELSDAVWQARSRGVQVSLLDDSVSDTGNRAPVLTELLDGSVDALNEAVPGDRVTVRVLPPGRPVAATLAVRSGDDRVHTREFAAHGPVDG